MQTARAAAKTAAKTAARAAAKTAALRPHSRFLGSILRSGCPGSTLSLEAKGEVAALHKKSMRELFKYWNHVEGKMRFNRDRGRLEGASKEG